LCSYGSLNEKRKTVYASQLVTDTALAPHRQEIGGATYSVLLKSKGLRKHRKPFL